MATLNDPTMVIAMIEAHGGLCLWSEKEHAGYVGKEDTSMPVRGDAIPELIRTGAIKVATVVPPLPKGVPNSSYTWYSLVKDIEVAVDEILHERITEVTAFTEFLKRRNLQPAKLQSAMVEGDSHVFAELLAQVDDQVSLVQAFQCTNGSVVVLLNDDDLSKFVQEVIDRRLNDNLEFVSPDESADVTEEDGDVDYEAEEDFGEELDHLGSL